MAGGRQWFYIGSISILSAVIASSASGAATISYAGTEIGGANTGFAVENWSNAAVPKINDVGGTDKFGTAGYYQIIPNTAVNFAEAVAGGNNLGISLVGPVPSGQLVTQFSTPSFLSTNPVGDAGTLVNFAGYPVFRTPDGVGLVQQGALSVSTPNAGTSPGGAGNWGNVISFTVATASNFRLGFAVDTVASGTFAADYISVFNPNTGTVFSTALTRDAVSNMSFFDIDADANENFTIALWQNGAGTGPVALSLVTFDVIPEPSSAGILALGLMTFAFNRRRKSAALSV